MFLIRIFKSSPPKRGKRDTQIKELLVCPSFYPANPLQITKNESSQNLFSRFQNVTIIFLNYDAFAIKKPTCYDR